MKTEYFRQKKWPAEWIAEAKRLAHEAYTAAAETATQASSTQARQTAANVAGVRERLLGSPHSFADMMHARSLRDRAASGISAPLCSPPRPQLAMN